MLNVIDSDFFVSVIGNNMDNILYLILLHELLNKKFSYLPHYTEHIFLVVEYLPPTFYIKYCTLELLNPVFILYIII